MSWITILITIISNLPGIISAIVSIINFIKNRGGKITFAEALRDIVAAYEKADTAVLSQLHPKA